MRGVDCEDELSSNAGRNPKFSAPLLRCSAVWVRSFSNTTTIPPASYIGATNGALFYTYQGFAEDRLIVELV